MKVQLRRGPGSGRGPPKRAELEVPDSTRIVDVFGLIAAEFGYRAATEGSLYDEGVVPPTSYDIGFLSKAVSEGAEAWSPGAGWAGGLWIGGTVGGGHR